MRQATRRAAGESADGVHVLDSRHASVRVVKNGSGDAVAIHQSTRRSNERQAIHTFFARNARQYIWYVPRPRYMVKRKGYLASSKEGSSRGFEVEGSDHVVLGGADGDERLSRTSAGSGPLEGTSAGTTGSGRAGRSGVGCVDDVAFLVENVRLHLQHDR